MINNEIISEIIIKRNYFNVKIINSYQNVRRENIEEICEIFINDKKLYIKIKRKINN